MKKYIVLIVTIGLFVASCGEKFDELKQAAEVIQKAPEIADNIQQDAARAEKRLEERRAKGDTLALHFSELMKYLPTSIEGYTAEEPTGSTTNTGEYSVTNVYAGFYKENAVGERSSIRVQIYDYNQGYAGFAFVTMWASMGMSVESTDGWQKTFDTGIEDVFAYEDYRHDGQRTELFYAIGYRFYMTIAVDNVEGTDFARSIAKKVDIKKLASL